MPGNTTLLLEGSYYFSNTLVVGHPAAKKLDVGLLMVVMN